MEEQEVGMRCVYVYVCVWECGGYLCVSGCMCMMGGVCGICVGICDVCMCLYWCGLWRVCMCEDVCGVCACGTHMVHLCALVCVVHGKSVWCMCDVCVCSVVCVVACVYVSCVWYMCICDVCVVCMVYTRVVCMWYV